MKDPAQDYEFLNISNLCNATPDILSDPVRPVLRVGHADQV